MKKIRRILVPTDLSTLSVAATAYAKTLAKAFRARIYVAHVVEGPIVVGEPNLDMAYAGLWPDAEQLAMRDLRTFASTHLRGTRDVELGLLNGNPQDELLRFAIDKRCGLIVMATHGRTGLSHALIGSVAERVARHSPVPVLLVKPSKMQRELPRRPKKR
jgi:universal stress protein A